MDLEDKRANSALRKAIAQWSSVKSQTKGLEGAGDTYTSELIDMQQSAHELLMSTSGVKWKHHLAAKAAQKWKAKVAASRAKRAGSDPAVAGIADMFAGSPPAGGVRAEEVLKSPTKIFLASLQELRVVLICRSPLKMSPTSPRSQPQRLRRTKRRTTAKKTKTTSLLSRVSHGGKT